MPTSPDKPLLIREGILKTIHMVGAIIRSNKALGLGKPEIAYQPCITVHCVDGTFHCRYFKVDGPLLGRQCFQKPKQTGAVAFLETRAAVWVSNSPLD